MTAPQLLPLHIEYDGPAPVETYFTPTTDEKGHKTAAFRGRSLYGVDLALPSGYAGAILSTEQKPAKNVNETRRSVKGDDGKLRISAVGTFETVGLWRADVPVDLKADEYARALDEWTRMAALVHAPDEE